MLILQRLLLLVVFFLLTILRIESQNLERLDLEVIYNKKALSIPFAGGMNAPQASPVDFNNDGMQDLYFFDRVGGVHMAFLQVDGSYRYAPSFVKDFPKLQHWVLLRDYNRDGVQDLFAYSDIPGINSIIAYKGYYRNDTLQFQKTQLKTSTGLNVLHAQLSTGGSVPIFISTIDYPDINDVDCDGDLDILTFNAAGGIVGLYANQSIEKGFSSDSLDFRLENNCWGGFFESGITETIDLATSQGSCVTNFLPTDRIENRHAGSTVLSIDMNGDQVKELILGDISFNNLVLLYNGGSCEEAWMNDQEIFFPINDTPVNLSVFPAAFYLDVNGDGNQDLLASPNAAIGADDIDVIWYYQNTGTNERPAFKFEGSNFLVEGMLDFGTGANPVFVDVDGDQLLDIVVGNEVKNQQKDDSQASLALLLNTGSDRAPQFTFSEYDFAGLKNLSLRSFVPHFLDLDHDNDLDLLVGCNTGELIYLENVANEGRRMQFGTPKYPFQGIDVGNNAAPTSLDVDLDGDLDLIIGETAGNLNLYENLGTPKEGIFDSTPSDDFWGAIDTRDTTQFALNGESKPTILLIQQDKAFIVTGSDAGTIRVHDWEPGLLAPFKRGKNEIETIFEGGLTKVDFADLDNDGSLEIIVGNQRGGLGLFQTDLLTPSMTTSRVSEVGNLSHSITPNPTNGLVTFQVPFKNGQCQVFDVTGRMMIEAEFTETRFTIDMREGLLQQGTYWYIIKTPMEQLNGKFIFIQ